MNKIQLNLQKYKIRNNSQIYIIQRHYSKIKSLDLRNGTCSEFPGSCIELELQKNLDQEETTHASVVHTKEIDRWIKREWAGIA